MDGIVILVDSSFYSSIETIKVDRIKCVLCARVLHAAATHILAVIGRICKRVSGGFSTEKIIQQIVRESSILKVLLTSPFMG